MRALILAAGVFFFLFGAVDPGYAKKAPVKKSLSKDEETLEDIEVIVSVPKPEAQIFTPKMKTRYESVVYEKGFVKELLETVEDRPF